MRRAAFPSRPLPPTLPANGYRALTEWPRSFEVARAEGLPGQGYDLVCLFDALRDMGDLADAARRIRQPLAPDGTLLLAEPNASRGVETASDCVTRSSAGPGPGRSTAPTSPARHGLSTNEGAS